MRRMSAFEISYWSTRYRRTLLGRPDFGTFEAILQHGDVAHAESHYAYGPGFKPLLALAVPDQNNLSHA